MAIILLVSVYMCVDIVSIYVIKRRKINDYAN